MAHIEVVKPADQQGENVWFIATVVCCVLIASVLIMLRTSDSTEIDLRPPNELSNTLIQITNLADEISFMQDAELLGKTFSVFDLYEHQLIPEAIRLIAQPVSGCLMFQQGKYDIRVLINASPRLISWQETEATGR